jgi:hypothetical protein
MQSSVAGGNNSSPNPSLAHSVDDRTVTVWFESGDVECAAACEDRDESAPDARRQSATGTPARASLSTKKRGIIAVVLLIVIIVVVVLVLTLRPQKGSQPDSGGMSTTDSVINAVGSTGQCLC